MGVYSTFDLTREEAVEKLQAGIMEATNEELAGALFGMFGNRELHNYKITDNPDNDNSNKYYPWELGSQILE